MHLFNNHKKAKTQAKPGNHTPSPPLGVGGLGPGWVSCYETISKLIKSGLLELKLNEDTPSAFLSLTLYRALMCDKTGIFVDDQRASAFLDKVRFVINFTRSYVSGLVVADLPEDVTVDESKMKYPPLQPTDWINIYVASSDEKSILLYGRWNSERLELRPYKAPPEDEVMEDEE